MSGGSYLLGKFYRERAIFQGALILRSNYPRGQLSEGGDNFRGQLSSGIIARGAIIQGAIIQGTTVQGLIIWGEIVRTPIVMYVTRIAVIITHAAINRGWRLTLNVSK